MRSIVVACALLVAAGSFVGASEPVVGRDAAPADVIVRFSQAIPPEPPVVAELPGPHPMAAGAQCCRTKMNTARASRPAPATPCGCCQKPAARTNAKTR